MSSKQLHGEASIICVNRSLLPSEDEARKRLLFLLIFCLKWIDGINRSGLGPVASFSSCSLRLRCSKQPSVIERTAQRGGTEGSESGTGLREANEHAENRKK